MIPYKPLFDQGFRRYLFKSRKLSAKKPGECTPARSVHCNLESPAAIENIIDIRVEFTRKKCKTSILLYCFHTAGVLHIFMLYNLLGPGISFYRKSKINVKRNPNYEIGWFHNWPMIISHRLYGFHFTNDDFPL